MNALVTGGAGFIGSALARALLDRGDEVRVIDDLSAGSRDAVPDGAEFIEADLRDLAAMEKATQGIEVVFHQAAVRSVPRSVEEPLLVHECNATGTLNLLVAAERAGARRLINASSGSVYGGVEEGASVESRPLNPISPYGVSKLAAEQYCRTWSVLDKLSTVSLRYFNVFGPGQSAESRYAAVFPAIISAVSENRSPEIHWDGEQSRDFTYVDDVVSANIAAAEATSDVDGESFNIAGGTSRTVNDVFETIRSIVGVDVAPEYKPRRAGDIRHSRADITKAQEALNWAPAAEWEPAVRTTVDWFRRGA